MASSKCGTSGNSASECTFFFPLILREREREQLVSKIFFLPNSGLSWKWSQLEMVSYNVIELN